MDQQEGVKQMIEMNKMAFDNTFNAVIRLQDEANSMLLKWLDMSTWIPPEGKKVFTQMSEGMIKSRNDFKSMADENFRKASEYFVSATKKQ